jgi:hypothetical protein
MSGRATARLLQTKTFFETSFPLSEAVLKMFFVQALLLYPEPFLLASLGCLAIARQDRVGDATPSLSFLSPRAFCQARGPSALTHLLEDVAPSEARGPSALACLGKTGWRMSPRAKRGVPRRLRASGRQGGKCHPERSEGSPWGRRPERSEGCLAIARQDKVGDAVPNKARDASLTLGTME